MPIPFRDLRSDGGSALAGYMRFVDEDAGRGIRAALFLVNARGEPVDFTFTRADIPASFLWRTGEARRNAVAALSASLFSSCSVAPAVLLVRAEEVHPGVFAEDVLVEIPLGRVASAADVVHGAGDHSESLGESIDVYWIGSAPAAESVARQLLDALGVRQLLLEPFDRAAQGLTEAFTKA
jgi:hypothetical protein